MAQLTPHSSAPLWGGRPYFIGLSLIALVAGACADNGCSGADDTPYPSPPHTGGSIIGGAAHLRIGDSALQVIAGNVAPLLGEFLDVDTDTGRATYRLGQAITDGSLSLVPGSSISFDLDNLAQATSLTFLQEDAAGLPGIRFAVRDVEVFVDITFSTDTALLGSAACRVYDDGVKAALTLPGLSFDLRVDLADDYALSARVDDIAVDVRGLTEQLAVLLDISPCDGSAASGCGPSMPSCTDNLDGCRELCGLIDLFAQLGGFIDKFLQPLLDSLAPQMAAAVSDNFIAAISNTRLGLRTVIATSAIGNAATDAPPIHIAAGVTSLELRGDGLSRGLHFDVEAGFAAAQPARCLGDGSSLSVLAPDLPAVLALEEPPLPGLLEVGQGSELRVERYDISLLFSELSLRQALWSAYVGGALCIRLDGDGFGDLTDGNFTLEAATLQTFDASGTLLGLAPPDAPLLLVIRPERPPFLRLGNGGAADPVIQLAIDDLSIGIYMLVDDAFVQLSNLLVDASVDIDLLRRGKSTMTAALAGIDIVEITEIYNELAPGADILGLVDVVLDFGLTAVLGTQLDFDLAVGEAVSGALGIPLNIAINTIRRERNAAGQSFLAAYISVCGAKERDDPLRPACHPPAVQTRQASLQIDLQTSGLQHISAGAGNLAITLPHRGTSQAVGDHRLLARVDGGLWLLAQRRPPADLARQYAVHSARLRLPGIHQVELLELPSGRRHQLAVTIPPRTQVTPEPGYTLAPPRPVLASDKAAEKGAPTTGCIACSASPLGLLLLAAAGLRRRRRYSAER